MAVPCTTLPRVGSAKPWWLDPQVAALIALVVGAYFIRLAELPLRGEEPTRAQIAFEMCRSHDWLVPREQREPFLSRPPLQNWAIAASAITFGNWGTWAVRFPSALAVQLTVLLLYGYSRLFLSRLGAFAGAAAFATFGEMFQMGPEAETESVFILLVTASLLLWHWGWVRRWPDFLTWSAGYGFMALAVLAKGPQPPVYFLGAVGAYVLLTRDWRRLFGVGHLIGFLVGAALIAAWAVPVYLQEGCTTLRGIVFSDTTSRFQLWKAGEVAGHLAVFPLIILGGTLPWSPLLLAFLSRDFRRGFGAARPLAQFAGAAVFLAFPTCWIPPGGQSRYFAPLYPCMAVLVGMVIERIGQVGAPPFLRASWRRFVLALAALTAGAGAAVAAAAFCLPGRPGLACWAEPPLVGLGYAAVTVGLAVLLFRVRAGDIPVRVSAAFSAVTAFMVLTFGGVLADVRLNRSENAAVEMARLKSQLPPDQPLVSLDGHTDSLFAYLYRWPIISPRPMPADEREAADLTYFCIVSPGDSRPKLPFAWEEIGAVSVDRNHKAVPERVVVVGRRLPPAAEGQAPPVAKPGEDVGRRAAWRMGPPEAASAGRAFSPGRRAATLP